MSRPLAFTATGLTSIGLMSLMALAGCASGVAPADGGPTADAAATAASQYCVDNGGTVQDRQPTFGTNNDASSWIALGDPIEVCRFQTVADDAKSRIYVDLVTLSSAQPTLAALAYLTKTPLPDTAGGNPASALCDQLGGASGYGTSADGGGLVNADDPDDVVFVPCVFADRSFIEEWGIAYHSDGTIRGADLSALFRFDRNAAPAVF